MIYPNRIEDAWTRVDKRGADECWPWRGSIDSHGYGRLSVNGKGRLAHRLVYELAHGVSPGVMLVCHRCDNPRCCNPAHLFLGTPADNMADRSAKGRAPQGEQVPHAKLTETSVRHIRSLMDAGWDRRELAEVFGVTPTNVSTIAARKTWRHVA